MRARDIMSSPVLTARPEWTIREAAALVTRHNITAAPVLDDDDRLVGMVSEGDLLTRRVPRDPTAHLDRLAADPADDGPASVRDVMATTVITLPPDADLADVAETMLGFDIRSIPIVDNGEVIGIISRRDILRAVSRTDDVVASAVQASLDSFAGHRRVWTADVTDGAVTIHGDFDDDAQRRVATILAKTVAGVRSVETVGV